MMDYGWGMGIFGPVWMFVFWGGLIALAIWLIKVLFPSTDARRRDDHEVQPSAQEILKRRYAQGELTTEQYQEMLQTIRQ
ncbi:MAG: SHOCT domain-containing protein [Anaerolineales bacterium]|nr:SHOCT domain-containing protein [Anaerolineales bacterium]